MRPTSSPMAAATSTSTVRRIDLDHPHGRCQAAQFKQGRTVSGRGIFLIPLSEVDPETGEMTPVSCFAHAALLVEVEVDDETGEVAVRDMQSIRARPRAQPEARRAATRRRRMDGHEPRPVGNDRTLLSRPQPWPRRLQSLPDAGSRRHRHHISVLERPAPDGPFGGKGPGEMCANPVLPAVANAVYDAVGVRIDELPITPERILRAVKASG